MGSEKVSISEKIKATDVTQEKLADFCGITRPTLVKYFSKYDEGDYHKIPSRLLDALQFADTHTSEEFSRYFKQISTANVSYQVPLSLFKKDKGPFGSKKMPIDAAYERIDMLNAGAVLNDDTLVPDIATEDDESSVAHISAIFDSRKIMDNAVKTYIDDNYSSDLLRYSEEERAFIGNFSRFDFGTHPHNKYFELSQYLDLASSIFSVPLITESNIPEVANLKNKVDNANFYVKYVLDRSADSKFSEDAIEEALDDLKRPTFRMGAPKQIYVAVNIISMIDDYPENDAHMDISVVRATSYQDAEYLSKLNYDNVCIRSTAAFGPFDNKSESDRVKSYLEIEWDDKFAEYGCMYEDGVAWLDQMSEKQVLRGKHA